MNSCWELLNIRETADRRSIKMAYTSLIKECSPETDPERFQQLRDAYEQAMYISQFLDEETSSEYQLEASPEHQLEASPEHQLEASPEHQLEASGEHQLKTSPGYQSAPSQENPVRALPEGGPEASPDLKKEASPDLKKEASPGHKKEALPDHKKEASPEHKPETVSEHQSEAPPVRQLEAPTAAKAGEALTGAQVLPEPPAQLAAASAPQEADFLTAEVFMAWVNAVWENPRKRYEPQAWLALLETDELQDILLKQELWYSLFHFFADIVHRDAENNTIRFPQQVIRAYNEVFLWSEDELELQRCFDHEHIQAMMWLLKGERATPTEVSSGESKGGWRNVWAWMVVLFILVKVFTVLERRDGDQPAADSILGQTQALVEQGEYQKALDIARPFAERGNAYAQNLMGAAYQKGWTFERDQTEAVRWFRLAAEQDFVAAEVNLGLAYYYGRGVAQDYGQSRYWLDRAAAKKQPTALLVSGLQYLRGQGVEKDTATGVKQITAAARRGYALAEHELGLLYLDGEGVEQNDAEARYWFEKAAAQKLAAGQNSLGYLYENGRGVERDAAQALSHYRAAAAQEHSPAMFNVGRFYLLGLGVERDREQGVTWLTRAADRDYQPARDMLDEVSAAPAPEFR
ncbi:hypothetical protein FKG94_19425 [Exilibacterium tricleocarpae]|uniref:J domain-containing protein n=1 Tax=Exilibacterium tricleocarpae TaxID=2591008 RepID=A0A545T3N3_9GAMM|nr:SEL1-like repeat protein [Exilibacterium tricleocarpae]TQV71816.1 hypothetical protein FKG94_19425 [Exilibacterium tricleocarpae]